MNTRENTVDQPAADSSSKLDSVADLIEKFVIMIIKIVDMVKSLIGNI